MQVHVFDKTGLEGRAKGAFASILPWGDERLKDLIEPDLFATLEEEIELLDELVRGGCSSR